MVASIDKPDMREASRQHGNGLQTTRTYNRADNLVTAITAETAPGAGDRPGLSFAYTYDENKNVTAETTGRVMNGYNFTTNQDAKDRLTNWTRTNGDTQDWNLTLVGDWDQFTQDLGGPPTTADRTHNDAHEINNISGGPNNGTLQHDAKGNLTREGNDTVQRYFYDFDNQLSAVDENQDGTSEITYTYDALGRRVTKTVGGGGGTTVYVCETQGMPGGRGSMGKVVAEYEGGDPASDPIQKYVQGKYVDEPLMLITVNASTGVEDSHFYHQNRLYTITALTNAGGGIEERYAYTPYGDQTILNPTGGIRASNTIYQTNNTIGHQGLMHDQETKLIYNRARMLHPQLGRFMQRDPLGYVDGMSLYGYVTSNPVYWLDPWGLLQDAPGAPGYWGWVPGPGWAYSVGWKFTDTLYKGYQAAQKIGSANKRTRRAYKNAGNPSAKVPATAGAGRKDAIDAVGEYAGTAASQMPGTVVGGKPGVPTTPADYVKGAGEKVISKVGDELTDIPKSDDCPDGNEEQEQEDDGDIPWIPFF